MSEPLIALLAGVFLVGLAKWRWAVVAAMVLAVAEGAIRKWMLPDEQHVVYFLKDALLLGAYVAYFGGQLMRRQRPVPRHPANVPLALLAVLVVAEGFNPHLPDPLVGLFGIRAYLIYVPLMYMLPAVFRDFGVLRRFWLRYLVLALVPLLLGPLQFSLPRDSDLNRYSWPEEPSHAAGHLAITFGELGAPVRITGTFSFISGYTTYLLAIIVVALAMSLIERKFWVRSALSVLVVLASVNLLMTGSRGPFLVLAGALPVLLLIAFRSRAGRLGPVVMSALAVLPLLAALLPALFAEEVGSAFLARVRRADSVIERVVQPLQGVWEALEYAGPFGDGAGSAHQVRALLAPEGGRATPQAEPEWQRIVLELGPMGLVLTLIVRVLVALRLWRTLTEGPPLIRPLVASALIFVLAHFAGNVVFNHTAAIFYWFMAGMALVPTGTVPDPDPASAARRTLPRRLVPSER